MLPHAGSRCRQCDGATAEVSATSLSFRKPKFAAVCPTAVNTESRELDSVVNTDAGKRHGFRGSGGGDRNTATTRQEDRGRQEQETGTGDRDRNDRRGDRNRTGTAIGQCIISWPAKRYGCETRQSGWCPRVRVRQNCAWRLLFRKRMALARVVRSADPLEGGRLRVGRTDLPLRPGSR